MSKAVASVALLAGTASATATCPTTAQGWSCPSGGTTAMGCTAGDEQCKAWLAAHNLWRCMADVPFVSWNQDLYQNEATTFASQTMLQHSNSFGLAAPLGPSGEDQFLTSQAATPMDITRFWYKEVQSVPASNVWTQAERNQCGHYTTMLWQGVTQIGCYTNQHGLSVCQFWDGGASVSCSTPNMQGFYPANIYPPVRNIADCESMLSSCGLTVPDFTPLPYEEGPPPTTTTAGTTTQTPVVCEESGCDPAAAAALARQQLNPVPQGAGAGTPQGTTAPPPTAAPPAPTPPPFGVARLWEQGQQFASAMSTAQTRPGPVVVAAMAAGVLSLVAVSFRSRRGSSLAEENEPLQVLEE